MGPSLLALLLVALALIVVAAILLAARDLPWPLVPASAPLGSGVVPATLSGRRFRDELGVLNARIAAASDRVWLVTAGLPQRLR